METPSNTIESELPSIAALPADEVLGALATSAAGLTSEKAAEYQGKFGKNLIQAAKKKSPVLAFLSNFTHLMAILLWVAGIIALVAGMPELCVAVWLVNLINGCFSFWQEHQADKATEALKKMLPSYVNVIRDGRADPGPRGGPRPRRRHGPRGGRQDLGRRPRDPRLRPPGRPVDA